MVLGSSSLPKQAKENQQNILRKPFLNLIVCTSSFPLLRRIERSKKEIWKKTTSPTKQNKKIQKKVTLKINKNDESFQNTRFVYSPQKTKQNKINNKFTKYYYIIWSEPIIILKIFFLWKKKRNQNLKKSCVWPTDYL